MQFLALVPGLLAVALAAPQQIDFVKIDEQLPETTLVIPVTAAPTIIAFDPTAAIESVVANPTATASLLPKRGYPIQKRDDTSDCRACEVQKTTQNYLMANVADDVVFVADKNIAEAATNAATPSGYRNVFTNLKAASNGYVYMGYEMLGDTISNTYGPEFYDPSKCAAKCDSIAGCVAFNIYVERDPIVDPCSSTCQNPPAFANVKCSYWGGALTPGTAVNDGQYRNKFHVVIAGSNGYVSTKVPTAPGYSIGYLNAAAVNAPKDCNQVDTYMGYKLFSNTPFDVRLCAAACESQNVYNLAHPPKTGAPKLCKYWNTYLLDKNGISQGQYCSMYTETWEKRFATNVGQYRGSDHYTISSSYSGSNVTDPGYPVCA